MLIEVGREALGADATDDEAIAEGTPPARALRGLARRRGRPRYGTFEDGASSAAARPSRSPPPASARAGGARQPAGRSRRCPSPSSAPTFLGLSSPRVAPGLMSWPAWQAVASAERVPASDDTSPLFRAVTAAGHRVDVLSEPSAADLLRRRVGVRHGGLARRRRSRPRRRRRLRHRDRHRGESGRPAAAVEVLHASYDVPGARVPDLVADGIGRVPCPWDREQTHRSLARYLLEETYETLEAIDTEDYAHLRGGASATCCSRWSSTPGSLRRTRTTRSPSTTSPADCGQSLALALARVRRARRGRRRRGEANWGLAEGRREGPWLGARRDPGRRPRSRSLTRWLAAMPSASPRRPGHRSATGCSRSSWRRARRAWTPSRSLRDAVRRLADAVRTTETC